GRVVHNDGGAIVLPDPSVELPGDVTFTAMPGTQSFKVIVEGKENMTDADAKLLADFQRKVATLSRSIVAANDVSGGAKTRIGLLKRSAAEATVENKKFIDQAEALDNEIDAIINTLRGGRENSEIPPLSIAQRIGNVAGTIRLSTIKPTQTQLTNYELANSEFAPVLARLRKLVEIDLPRFEKELDAAGAPMTPGRLPQ
ncbi:MAG: hypothetical protein ABL959_25590, partial [Pyrinomonadaceae bacterium]